MQVHQSSRISFNLSWIHESFSEVQAIHDVIAAASPLEAFATSSSSGVAGAFFQFSKTARTGYFMDNSSSRNGINKSSFLARY